MTHAAERNESKKNRVILLLLSLTLGWFGADRFYLRKYRSGALKALSLGGLGIWWFIDCAMVAMDAFAYTFGKDSGMVKNVEGKDLQYGFSLYRLKDGRFERDWFSRAS